MTISASSMTSTRTTHGSTLRTIRGGESATAASTTTNEQKKNETTLPTRQTRTAHSGPKPSSRKASGLLAYADGKVVGWCNTGPRRNYQNLHSLASASDPSEPVGSILCFVVAAPYRGKGVCTMLLNAACDKLRSDGFQIAEGYPRTLPSNANNPYNTPIENLNYRGSLSTFLKTGFTIHQQLERHAIVRRRLQP